ncbi:glycosyltransferase [Riemerella anatipestifer]|uniref:glycosyltransferase n=1 Tax=Riemerella anatipestifer TaxID=34085 RepID=UPI00129ED99E|nr:glycosyltransferase [Riemerella anatipestifer]
MDSILSQNFKDFQLILINDGSTDNSIIICENYEKEYDNVKVVSQCNKGVSQARKVGVQNAEGDYITFIDSDDYLPHNNVFDIMNNSLDIESNSDLDILIGGGSKSSLLSVDEYLKKILLGNSAYTGPWAKWYKRKLFNDFVFDIPREIRVGEDFLMNIRLVKAREHIAIREIPDEVYTYVRNNSGSLTAGLKRTENYEHMFYQELKKSFVQEKLDDFTNEIISSRLNGLKYIALSQNYRVNANHIFYRELLKDIKEEKYKLSIGEKLLFKSMLLYAIFSISDRIIRKIFR